MFKLFALFLEGLLSFFSPCILPILPVYIGVLGGNNGEHSQNNRMRTVINTSMFVLGIAMTFFLLAFTSSFLSRLLNQHIRVVQIISGILIIAMGLFQLGWIRLPMLSKELSAKTKVYQAGKTVTPIIAFLMGFTFSFSWTPCIGPILASVFFYASSQSGIWSIALLSVYCIGFILPFILVAIFSQKLLDYFKKQTRFLQYTKTISAVILIIIGISILTGSFGTLFKIRR
ncbi:cytochrome C biogenesis protein CcdA [Streptococcus ruminantium]|nr:cytochrome C biogenesis protein CcdA [Streptococcus ruminantium]BDD39939.1 cytochrome C biogenesis protein CcdA [Streptococcus ruminantium]BDD41868.1 cytochrome C biogenesis protein CcdA [Streptococcus ruminantium]